MKKQVAVSEFKTHCLQIINKIEKSQETIIITKRDRPVAKIMSLNNPKKTSIIGLLKNKGKIVGDIIRPIDEKWNS